MQRQVKLKLNGNISIDWLLTKIYINWIQKLTVTLG